MKSYEVVMLMKTIADETAHAACYLVLAMLNIMI